MCEKSVVRALRELFFFFTTVHILSARRGTHEYPIIPKTAAYQEEVVRTTQPTYTLRLSLSPFSYVHTHTCERVQKCTAERRRRGRARAAGEASLAPFGRSASRALRSQQCARRGTSVRTRKAPRTSPLGVGVLRLHLTYYTSAVALVRAEKKLSLPIITFLIALFYTAIMQNAHRPAERQTSGIYEYAMKSLSLYYSSDSLLFIQCPIYELRSREGAEGGNGKAARLASRERTFFRGSREKRDLALSRRRLSTFLIAVSPVCLRIA